MYTEQMPYTYMLRCADDSLYVGSTADLDQRLAEHAAGTVDSYTRQRRPVEAIWFQEFGRIDEAYAMEVRLKGWRRAKKLALARGDYASLPGLARPGSRAAPDGT